MVVSLESGGVLTDAALEELGVDAANDDTPGTEEAACTEEAPKKLDDGSVLVEAEDGADPAGVTVVGTVVEGEATVDNVDIDEVEEVVGVDVGSEVSGGRVSRMHWPSESQYPSRVGVMSQTVPLGRAGPRKQRPK